jgi:hypothetical protein
VNYGIYESNCGYLPRLTKEVWEKKTLEKTDMTGSHLRNPK